MRARRARCSPGALAIAVAVAGYLVSRGIPHTPAVAPDLAINWNPFTETWRNLRFAHGQPRRLAVDARHLVVLVLRRDLPRPVRRLRARRPGRRRARRHVPARAVLGRHRHRLAAVRAAVGPQGRARPRAVRLDRPDAVRDRPVAREPRLCTRTALAGLDAFLAQPRALARRRRPGADRPLRRLLHRAALRADPGALGAVAPVADHRRQQHPQRAVHGRLGGHRDRAARRGLVDPAALPRHRR